MFRKRLESFNSCVVANGKVYLIILTALIFLLALHSIFWVIPGILLIFGFYWFFNNQASRQRQEIESLLDSIIADLERSTFYALENLPTAATIFDDRGGFVWGNTAAKSLLKITDKATFTLDKLSPELHINRLEEESGHRIINMQDKILHVDYRVTVPSELSGKIYILYIHDITAIEEFKANYERSRPVIGFVQIDNLNDVSQGMTDGQRSALMSEVGLIISEWIAAFNGIGKQYTDDTYFLVFEKQQLLHLVEQKFDVLDKVRDVKEGNKVPVTLSIGVATDEDTLNLVSQKAYSCLDLALGRGGDQAAISLNGAVQFFGGKSAATEKSTRVRARIVSQSIADLIKESDNIFVMGHVNEDYDSIGSALGVAKIASLANKPVHIIISGKSTSLKKCESSLMEYKDFGDMFISAAKAKDYLTENSLLILVDFHRPSLAAGPTLLEQLPRKVIIDHHRRAEDIFKDTLICYLEPSASSTSELVTELLFYYNERPDLSRFEASMLYAGIALDTKSFFVQTGARTFEAAAMLRRAGADPGIVRQLFSDDFATTKARAEIVAHAEQLFDSVLISVASMHNMVGASVAIAQAADYMLLTKGITCSVVIADIDEENTIISARSNGKVNVQVVLEAIGGGGHQTVAGVQLKNINVAEIKEKIIALIEAQIKETEE